MANGPRDKTRAKFSHWPDPRFERNPPLTVCSAFGRSNTLRAHLFPDCVTAGNTLIRMNSVGLISSLCPVAFHSKEEGACEERVQSRTSRSKRAPRSASQLGHGCLSSQDSDQPRCKPDANPMQTRSASALHRGWIGVASGLVSITLESPPCPATLAAINRHPKQPKHSSSGQIWHNLFCLWCLGYLLIKATAG
jgi:hypothetical protein